MERCHTPAKRSAICTDIYGRHGKRPHLPHKRRMVVLKTAALRVRARCGCSRISRRDHSGRTSCRVQALPPFPWPRRWAPRRNLVPHQHARTTPNRRPPTRRWSCREVVTATRKRFVRQAFCQPPIIVWRPRFLAFQGVARGS